MNSQAADNMGISWKKKRAGANDPEFEQSGGKWSTLWTVGGQMIHVMKSTGAKGSEYDQGTTDPEYELSGDNWSRVWTVRGQMIHSMNSPGQLI